MRFLTKQLGLAALAVGCLLSMVGCAGDTGGEQKASESDAAEATATSLDAEFEFVTGTDSETKVLVGHGITLTIPSSWKSYEEQPSMDGTTYEGAVGDPSGEVDDPYIQFSMAKDTSGPDAEELVASAESLASVDRSIEILSHDPVELDGLDTQAPLLQLKQDSEKSDGTNVRLEQHQVFLDMPGGRTSAIRFIAVDGQWKSAMGETFRSLKVTLP